MKRCFWVVTSRAPSPSLDPIHLQADLICQHDAIPCIPSEVRISRRLLDLGWSQSMDQLAQNLATDQMDLNRNLLTHSLPRPASFMLNTQGEVTYWCPLCGECCGTFVDLRRHVARHSQQGSICFVIVFLFFFFFYVMFELPNSPFLSFFLFFLGILAEEARNPQSLLWQEANEFWDLVVLNDNPLFLANKHRQFLQKTAERAKIKHRAHVQAHRQRQAEQRKRRRED